MKTTVIGDDAGKSTVDLDQARGASRFGILSFDEYAAAVLAESNRLFEAQQ